MFVIPTATTSAIVAPDQHTKPYGVGVIDPVVASPADDRIAALIRALIACSTATAMLETRCSSGKITVRKLSDRFVEPSAETRERLGVAQDAVLGYRHVELMCGNTVMSRAQNWFVLDRLTPAIRAMLETTDIPYGRAIGTLGPLRTLIDVHLIAGNSAVDGGSALCDDVLSITAMVHAANGMTLAEVHEIYTSAALSD